MGDQQQDEDCLIYCEKLSVHTTASIIVIAADPKKGRIRNLDAPVHMARI